jgi:hypothetical protein
VVNVTGTRAIGTYIPALGADRAPNPVIAAVLSGQTYHGTAFVVDSWYVTAYQPLTDDAGQVIGMLYVGVKQESLPTLRQILQTTTAGEHGTVWVLGGVGDRAGTVLVSPDGTADGTSLLDAKDANGKTWMADSVAAATALDGDAQTTVHYQDPKTGPHTVQLA